MRGRKRKRVGKQANCYCHSIAHGTLATKSTQVSTETPIESLAGIIEWFLSNFEPPAEFGENFAPYSLYEAGAPTWRLSDLPSLWNLNFFAPHFESGELSLE